MSSKVPGKQDQESRLVPALRFPEFRDADGWEFKTLNHLLSEPKQRNRNLKYGPGDVLSVSGEYGCVNQIEFMGRSYAGVSVKDYHVVETGDVVYTKSPLKVAPFGIIKANKGRSGIVSTLYAVYRPTANARSDYLDHYFSRNYNLNSYLQPIVKKGAKNDMKVKNSDVLTGSVWVPKIDEQKKIADCLSSIDTLIAVEAEKLEALKDHKRGLMQQLFPAPGETTPRLRFPEFRGAADWIVQPLGEIFDTASGGTPERKTKEYWGGDIPWITTSMVDSNIVVNADQFITTLGLKNSSAKLFPKNTVLIAMYGQGKTRGKAAMLGIEAATNQACAAILPKEGIDPNYVFLNLVSRYDELRVLSNSGGQENLSQGLVCALPFSYPENIAEQERISAFLSSIDALIDAQDDKINTLKAHKQGLMQQLFPVADQVQA